MDPLLLARIQFAVTVGFHFLFPPLTFGLTLFIVLFETGYTRTRDEFYRTISSFLVKILALVFVVGVATGLTMEFSFGTNWSSYSRVVGDIFGAPLAAEGIFSFFLESVFLGILVFGRKKVSQRVYLLSAVLVFVASHLSGLWILIANSWMQTPDGFIIENGIARLDSFWDAALNASIMERYLHTVLAGWLTGAFFIAGISSWYLIKKKHTQYAQSMLKYSIITIFAISIFQLGAGHAHSVQVAKTQPEKMAAFEALWETQDCAPMALFGYPDKDEPSGVKSVAIPCALSYLIAFDGDHVVPGLEEFRSREDFDAMIAEMKENNEPAVFDPKTMTDEEVQQNLAVRPPVHSVFQAYHIMISLGMIFIGIGALGVFLLWRKKLYNAKWFLMILLLAIPLPQIANQTGWIAAEVGRQPWAVFHVLPTERAASLESVVSGGHVLFSLIMFSLIYTLLFAVFMLILIKIIKKGPEEAVSKQGY